MIVLRVSFPALKEILDEPPAEVGAVDPGEVGETEMDLHGFDEEPLFPSEVAVDQRRVHTGLGGDLAHRGAFESAFGKGVTRRLDQPLPRRLRTSAHALPSCKQLLTLCRRRLK
jgi:hypothetical protein